MLHSKWCQQFTMTWKDSILSWMNHERLLLWLEMVLCNHKPPSSWSGNSLYHRGFLEIRVIHCTLCTVKGTKPVLTGQLHAKTWAAWCPDCKQEICVDHQGGFHWLLLKKPQSTFSTTLSLTTLSDLILLVQMKKKGGEKAVELYSYGCIQKDWKCRQHL